MKKTVVILAVILATGAWAQGKGPGPGPGGDDGAPPEQWHKRAQMMATLAIADALGLDDAGTVKLRSQLAKFEERRAPLRQQLMDQSQILRRAAKGDTTAFGQVDGAIQKIIALRGQIEQVDRDLFTELSTGLPPQKKAELALVMARLPMQLREMARGKGRQ